MKKSTHVMVDLETLGKGSRAVIASIGAVVFDPFTGNLGPQFYTVVDLNNSAKYGEMDGSTVKWWLQQSDAARAIFSDDTESVLLTDALYGFNQWLSDQAKANDLHVWGNGCDFDNVILQNAYDAAEIGPYFTHWNNEHCRTIVTMGREILGINPKNDIMRQGVHHTALDDAKFQAIYVSEIWMAFSKAEY